ncbi:hypothetical protein DFP73DRAFT_562479 [Morchella snyderi]|nr:hypothetical protein DFP73DRAFT_562479 [Morchella snyderi]
MFPALTKSPHPSKHPQSAPKPESPELLAQPRPQPRLQNERRQSQCPPRRDHGPGQPACAATGQGRRAHKRNPDYRLQLCSTRSSLRPTSRAAPGRYKRDPLPTPPLAPDAQSFMSTNHPRRCKDCHCRCRLLTRGPSTQAPGVYLGLVRATDVLALGERARKDLEDGLKLIVQHLVPRGPGTALTTTPRDLLTKCSSDMAALLDKVSLRADPLPVDGEPNFEAFMNTGRGRYRRLGDARQGYLGVLSVGARRNSAHFETLLQLVLFFGIDVEALP